MSTLKHEDIEIKDSNGQRLKLIRQDRIHVEEISSYIELNNQQFQVVNFSAFGIAVKSKESWNKGMDLIEVPFVYGSVEVSQLHLKFIREDQAEEGYVVAFEVVGEPISFEQVRGIKESLQVIEEHSQKMTDFEKIPEDFRMMVYRAKDWIERLQRKVETLEQTMSQTDGKSRRDFEETVIPLVGRYIGDLFPKYYETLANAMKLNEEEVKVCVSFFRESLMEALIRTPFSKRAFEKPLGYAGDYEMMNLIYKNENIGSSLFGRALEYYYLNEPAPKAVRNRAKYLTSLLVDYLGHSKNDHPPQILSVASGPSIEWQKMISEVQSYNNKKAHIDLLDQDGSALKSAQHEIRLLSNQHKNEFDFRFINLAIKNVIAQGLPGDKKYDLIYSAGLFDYLSAPVAQMAAQKLMAALNPGGELVIGNFSLANPSAALMDLGLDWNLILRSEEEMLSMFSHTGGSIRVEKEPLGINLFCHIKKPSEN